MDSIQNLLSASGTLAQLQKALVQQQQLLREIRSLLPAPLDLQLKAAVLNGRVLTLLVSSPVWASRLRYLAPQLLRQLGQQGLLVEQVRPRIAPLQGISRQPGGRRLASLSPASADSLMQTADAIEAGPLRDALIRLSRHRK